MQCSRSSHRPLTRHLKHTRYRAHASDVEAPSPLRALPPAHLHGVSSRGYSKTVFQRRTYRAFL
ncbi:hypothetical protein, partial [Acinetobacter soli]|uniref:hypothetical protein n=1 Tax=Acinetobacter soli TaxID=487316 RepID=UPI001C09A11F